MSNITLREFKTRFYPTLTDQQFSERIGFDNSFINKVMNGTYITKTSNTPKLVSLKTYVKNISGKDLILESAYINEFDKVDKIIKNFQREIKDKDRQIKELLEVVNELTSSVRVICGAKTAIERGSFVLSKYRR